MNNEYPRKEAGNNQNKNKMKRFTKKAKSEEDDDYILQKYCKEVK